MQRNQRRHAHYVTLTPKVKEGFLQLRPHMAIGYFYGLLVCFIHKITRKFPDIFSYFCCFSSKGDVSVFLSVLRWEADKYQYWNMEKDEGKFIFMTMHFSDSEYLSLLSYACPTVVSGEQKICSWISHVHKLLPRTHPTQSLTHSIIFSGRIYANIINHLTI